MCPITESQKETLHNVLRRLYIIVAVALLQTRTNKNRLVTDLWWTCGGLVVDLWCLKSKAIAYCFTV